MRTGHQILTAFTIRNINLQMFHSLMLKMHCVYLFSQCFHHMCRFSFSKLHPCIHALPSGKLLKLLTNICCVCLHAFVIIRIIIKNPTFSDMHLFVMSLNPPTRLMFWRVVTLHSYCEHRSLDKQHNFPDLRSAHEVCDSVLRI